MVIFDLDDTLYDYETCNVVAEKELLYFISQQLSISFESSAELLAQAKANVKKQLGNVASSHNRLLYMQDICEQKGVNPLVFAKRFYNVYWDAMLDKMILFPYVKPLFQELHRRGIKTGVLTDMTAYIQYRKIDKLGLSEDIDIFTTSEEAGEEKPSKKIFYKILSKIPYKPEEILFIGDSMEKDVQGATELGMQALHFQKGKDILKEVERLL